MIYAHITEAGERLGISAELLNRQIERHERNLERKTITLAPTEYRELPVNWRDDIPDGWTPQGGSPAPAPGWV
ncbi:hypothetical protein [Pseudosulfitobacter pseudonitzschiae]|uniref:hypothetical protein n=1 Tax=Pseudosulfitobacter pseudonitzschiae TaxID=1402135 RepID=UPI001AF9661F|nr:hypothetical protein [Pseudosulfitobacter pseudonitzschiae]MBM1817183.1 hypothetical protein [Pseudosulfitobacter pseudonitzschiae]MBM1834194.1 hypothetical protein [Pseudosulfitobacter pseudonitzschiae]MBM1839059.1 hypothetical protein [Pseudosulfitobacter pseudonitzschiae]MBM1843907.1 hypothetical protein [Pseudosulfitobacter pseudonitzschiae]MBM1848744.1 hypothetical protein [Pseudosulfitobacter pseudonitzschiae]